MFRERQGRSLDIARFPKHRAGHETGAREHQGQRGAERGGARDPGHRKRRHCARDWSSRQRGGRHSRNLLQKHAVLVKAFRKGTGPHCFRVLGQDPF